MIDKFLENLSDYPFLHLLSNSKIGLEKEALRVDKYGTISYKMHPLHFGASLTNKFITTDYSEALIEVVTPPCNSHEEAINYLENIIGFVYRNLNDEYLWPASMPCIIAGDKSIPIAYYGTSNAARMKTTYRRGLGNRYGRIMQVISGIHFNYSFSNEFWKSYKIFKKSNKSIKDFKSDQYFCIARNLLRNDWIILYLFGCSPAVCKSYLSGKETDMESFDEYTYFEKYATSLRMGDIGYQNNVEEDMGVHIDYNSIENYSKSLERAISTSCKKYEKIGVYSEGYYKQINSNTLQIENEYYSSVRPKPDPGIEKRPSKALIENGVDYIELRSIDNNIFLNNGIDICQMHFIELLIIYCLLCPDSKISNDEYFEIKDNLKKVAHNGRNNETCLKVGERNLKINIAVKTLLDSLMEIAKIMDKIMGDKNIYEKCILEQKKKINDNKILPSNLMLNEMKNKGMTFYELCMENIWRQKKYFDEMKKDDDIIQILQEETRKSILKKNELENKSGESYEDYIKKYFK